MTSYESVREEFLKRGVGYALVEYGSRLAIPAVFDEDLQKPMWPEERMTSESTIKLLGILQQLSARNGVVFARDGMALIRIGTK